ncbi:MAG: dTDP-4-dehydrorhamnose 3,5-epimerase [Cytophagales bacterium]|nr:dTDP-4-dehydrorhamnose 3,5-epimerase [Cytophagales bacterium]
MQVIQTPIADLLILEPKVFGDERGFFYESFNQAAFNTATNTNHHFVQDNHSQSSKGVLRGLHYQTAPHAQGKLVRVVQGEVWDVAVDIRTGSPTRGQWYGVLLSAENKRQLWVPPGFAHGFVTLSDTAEFLYKTTEFYNPAHEQCILWNDPRLGINWQLDKLSGNNPILSKKDLKGLPFKI